MVKKSKHWTNALTRPSLTHSFAELNSNLEYSGTQGFLQNFQPHNKLTSDAGQPCHNSGLGAHHQQVQGLLPLTGALTCGHLGHQKDRLCSPIGTARSLEATVRGPIDFEGLRLKPCLELLWSSRNLYENYYQHLKRTSWPLEPVWKVLNSIKHDLDVLFVME